MEISWTVNHAAIYITHWVNPNDLQSDIVNDLFFWLAQEIMWGTVLFLLFSFFECPSWEAKIVSFMSFLRAILPNTGIIGSFLASHNIAMAYNGCSLSKHNSSSNVWFTDGYKVYGISFSPNLMKRQFSSKAKWKSMSSN